MKYRNKIVVSLVFIGFLLSASLVSAKSFTVHKANDVNQIYFSVNGTNGRVGIGLNDPIGLLHVAGTENILLNTTGNIGIGTTAPSTKLDVAGTGRFTGVVTVPTPTGDSHAATKNYVDTTIASSVSDATYWTKSGNNLYSNASGNVGIGTTAPGYKLDVNGQLRSTGLILSGETASTLVYLDGSKNIKSLPTATYPTIAELAYVKGVTSKIQTQLDTKFTQGGNSFGAVATIGTNDSYNLVLETANTPRLTIASTGDATFSGKVTVATPSATGHATTKSYVDDAVNAIPTGDISGSGTTNYLPRWTGSKTVGNSVIYQSSSNIGIGTTAPGYKLDVSGNARFTGAVTVPTPTAASHAVNRSYVDTNFVSSSTLPTITNAFVQNGNAFAAKAMLGTTDNQDLGIKTNNAERITILKGGNIGIGTTAPSTKLDVAGNGRFTGEVSVKTAVAGDHAVNKDYLESSIGSLASGVDSLYYVEGEGTVAGTWTGTLNGLNAYYDGLTIAYKINIAGASTTTLNINNLGPILVRRNNGNLTTHLPVNTVVVLTYTTIGGVGYWVWADYDSDTLYYIRWTGPNVTAGAEVTKYKIVMEGHDGRFYPIAVGNSTAANAKTISSAQFKMNGQILWYAASGIVSENSVIASTNLYSDYYITSNSRYNFNQLSGWTAGKALYLVGTINSNGYFVLDGAGTTGTGFMTQDLPTTDDGKVYVSLGYMTATTYGFKLTPDRVTYHFKDGKIRLYETMSGTGTNNYITKWKGSTALGNSQIYDNGTNVGIGTTAPAYKLDVNGPGKFTNAVIVGSPSADNHAATRNYVDTTIASSVSDATYWTKSGNNLYSNVSGNVGIGTASPYSPLEVFTADNSNLSAVSVHRSSLNGGYVGYGFSVNGGNNGFKQSIAAVRTGGWGVGDLLFILNNNAASGNATLEDEKMRITSSGNVGIGTTSPTHKLDVAGTGRFTGEVSVKTAVAGDHAVNKDYLESSIGSLASGVDSLYYVEGDGTTAGVWTGTLNGLDAYYNGLTIAYKINIAGISGGTTLNINNLGPIAVRRNNAVLTTHLPVDTVVVLTYTTIGGVGYWVWADYDSDSGYYYLRWNGPNVTAGTEITRYKIIMEGHDGRFYPVTENNSTAANAKTISNAQFKMNGQVLWYTATTVIAENGSIASTNLYSDYYSTSYSAYTLNQISGWTVGRAVYLVGTVNNNGYFVLDGSGTTGTSFMTQDLPTTDDGKVYMLLGYMAHASGYIKLTPDRVTYHFKDGKIRLYETMSGTGTNNYITKWKGSTALGNSQIYDNGTSVGIGTASPTEKLEVVGGVRLDKLQVANYTYLNIGDINTTPTSDLNIANKAYVDSAVGAIDSYWTKSGNNIYNNNSHNVGIGATVPYGALNILKNTTITDSSNINNYQLVISNSTDTNSAQAGIAFRISATQDNTPGAAIVHQRTSSHSQGGLLFKTRPSTASNATLVTQMAIDKDGNIGIGTTAPAYKLDVSGAGRFTGKLIVDTPTANNHAATKGYVDSSITENFAAVDNYWTKSGNNIYSNNTANVGVGTTAPAYKLDVSGTGRFTGKLIVDTPTANNHATTKAYVDNNFISYAALPDKVFIPDGNSFGTKAILGTNDNYALGIKTNGAERLTVLANGNVGIGVTSPSAKLAVNGDIYFTGGDRKIINTYNNGSLSFGTNNIEQMTIDRYGSVWIGKNNTNSNSDIKINGGMALGIFASPYSTTSIIPFGGLIVPGRVGIGTDNPEYLLDVSGDARIESITGVNKLTVATIDPLYDIGGTKYSTYAPSVVGGVKEEYIGRGEITKCNDKVCSELLDFTKVNSGSDLWVWHQVVDFSPKTVDVIMTAYGQPALLSYEIKNQSLIFYSDRPTKFSYRLVGSRFDWKEWPTLATDQSEEASLIVR